MTIEQVFYDKTIKAKGKVSTIGEWLTTNELPIEELLAYAEKQKATDMRLDQISGWSLKLLAVF